MGLTHRISRLLTAPLRWRANLRKPVDPLAYGQERGNYLPQPPRGSHRTDYGLDELTLSPGLGLIGRTEAQLLADMRRRWETDPLFGGHQPVAPGEHFPPAGTPTWNCGLPSGDPDPRGTYGTPWFSGVRPTGYQPPRDPRTLPANPYAYDPDPAITLVDAIARMTVTYDDVRVAKAKAGALYDQAVANGLDSGQLTLDMVMGLVELIHGQHEAAPDLIHKIIDGRGSSAAAGDILLIDGIPMMEAPNPAAFIEDDSKTDGSNPKES